MSILSLFYRWAMHEEYATAEPFTYRAARALFAGTGREVRVNLAVRRTPKPHVTIKYLEPDFTELFRRGLRGLAPDGSQDTGFHGRELTRNAWTASRASHPRPSRPPETPAHPAGTGSLRVRSAPAPPPGPTRSGEHHSTPRGAPP
ncbi:hypothetical protein [Streptomyces sp. NPDC047985]|uniref:hypothetical protein n=1 Tax=unclassified Streptomyces TaxID=2593676 RepID=UPI0034449133